MGIMASNNKASPSEICFKMKSCQLLFAHHISFNWEILQKICCAPIQYKYVVLPV